MRKLLALAASAAVATVALGAMSASTAHADNCPAGDGTVPGTASRVITVGPFYIDDRDFADADDDDVAGGLWIYMESGKKAGLQRGGDQVVFTVLEANGVDPTVPYQGPVKTGVIRPDTNKELILFPNGIGGGSLAEEAGSHDDCFQDIKANRDVIVF